jgi:regulator of sigma E protease
VAATSDYDRRGYIQLYFAMLIFILVLFAWGETYLPTANVKYGIVTDTVGYAIGLRNGDKILLLIISMLKTFMKYPLILYLTIAKPFRLSAMERL